ncbi:MAG: formylmethanofuran dehydrogenase subunit E family protein [Methanotrichaceae archaeon]|nr:formylmethanofuran dehydrogenase subunit E family protein [Methanotrichaceae archaeon]
MNHAAGGCRYTGINRDYSIEDLAAFHGHLGPYIVMGYRIGRYVRQHFCSDPFQMKGTVFCKGVPPQSCLADGIQIGSGCTLGKRNIEIIASGEILCEFACGERKMVLKPRQISFPPQGSDNYSLLIEKLAEDMYGMPDSELFTTGTG